jgi:hypothetical protein
MTVVQGMSHDLDSDLEGVLFVIGNGDGSVLPVHKGQNTIQSIPDVSTVKVLHGFQYFRQLAWSPSSGGERLATPLRSYDGPAES